MHFTGNNLESSKMATVVEFYVIDRGVYTKSVMFSSKFIKIRPDKRLDAKELELDVTSLINSSSN